MNKPKTILAILFVSVSIFSQSHSNTFDKSSVAISYIKSTEHNGLDTYWNIENSFGGYFQTQFYIGDISVGISHTSFKGLKTKYPDFSSNYIYLSWIGVIDLPLNSSFGAGIKIGSYLMTFESDTLNSFQKNESELAVGPYAIFTLPVFNHLSLNVSGEFITVFTKRSMKFFNISAGVSYSFSTPDWLKRVFE
ncbi:MAG: hypothetical protein L3J41_09695 [Melioribacteraceae bacterium]|nr:hypothetical protein [Melioribacteraceae bacterium]